MSHPAQQFEINPEIEASLLRERLRAEFYAAPDDALLGQDLVAVALGRSTAWCEMKRLTGGGPQYLKLGRRCLYRKSAVLRHIAEYSTPVRSTSEYSLLESQRLSVTSANRA
jgi:hypothetical protein